MSGRFPGASNVRQFWQNLLAGRESITFFAPEELDPSVRHMAGDPSYVKAKGIVEGVEFFDATFFGVSPAEARMIDPQQRILLELAWAALEDAGYGSDARPRKIGVYVGTNFNRYEALNVARNPQVLQQFGEFSAALANEADFPATRISYKLNLTGPSVSLFTACSTGLVAVSEAVKSLLSYECDMAIAGAASVTLPQREGYMYLEGGMLSSDGHTRSFDVSSSGTTFNDGAALVLLKRLEEAIADRDHVYAVIRGAAINNDGAEKMSFTAPSVAGQAEVIASALGIADVEPASITYVETHGTATPLGDPIEVEALNQVYARSGEAGAGSCVIGSLKSNVGHMTHAAGAAGLIKLAMSAERGVIPGTLHFHTPNPALGLDRTRFRVTTGTEPWTAGPWPRRGAVSSFGVGGTNAHVIVEEPPVVPPSDLTSKVTVALLSARHEAGPTELAQALADRLEDDPQPNMGDVAYTLAIGRRFYTHRLAVIGANRREMVDALRGGSGPRVVTGKVSQPVKQLVYAFPGQGAQIPGMGAELYRDSAAFRAAMDECLEVADTHLDIDLRGLTVSPVVADDAQALLDQTRYTQPALFAIGYALARHLESLGVRPDAMVGHSVGEFVAATLSGVMTLATGMRLVIERGRLMQGMPPGGMLVVELPEDRAAATGALHHLTVAAMNASDSTVLAGELHHVDAAERELQSQGIRTRRLRTSHAFHSPMMDAAVEAFGVVLSDIELRAPRIPILSTSTGKLLSTEDAISTSYWQSQLRLPVQFAAALRTLLAGGRCAIIELGPGGTLTSLAQRQATDEHVFVAALGTRGVTEPESVMAALAQLWANGADIAWANMFEQETRSRVSLPTYPFERQRHWIEPAHEVSRPLANGAANRFSSGAPAAESAAQPAKELPDMSSTQAHYARMLERVVGLFEAVSGMDLRGVDVSQSLVALGFDSLFMTQVSAAIRREFSVPVSFRQLSAELDSPQALARHLAERIPIVAAPQPVAEPLAGQSHDDGGQRAEAVSRALDAAAGSPMQAVIAEQLRLMSRQLDMLSSGLRPVSTEVPSVVPMSSVASPDDRTRIPAREIEPSSLLPGKLSQREGDDRPVSVGDWNDLDATRREALQAFISEHVARTAASKRHVARYRARHADPRTAAGFNRAWKEIVYPIVCERSSGSRLWDLDGNEYIDLLNGFGPNFLGHGHPEVVAAIQSEMARGFEIGPQQRLAGEVAELVCELTGMDRASFMCTGSEAVQAAIRCARTFTQRDKIVLFRGDYHGNFDEVLVRGVTDGGYLRTTPSAPGIPIGSVGNVIVLEYGHESALSIIEEIGEQLAAVLVEPVQSRRPELQPREFLHRLRAITERQGTLLIFDEVVTGFRCHPGGAQAHFGVRADLATYGKVAGGNMPLGIVAGRSEVMDTFDGGSWEYGDDSRPEAGVTFFAGTFVRQPFAIAGCHAMLSILKREGPQLQQRVSAMAEDFAGRVNALFTSHELPFEIPHFSSVMYLRNRDKSDLGSLLWYYLRHHGVFALEGFPTYFTASHTAEDVNLLVERFRLSIERMIGSGLLPSRSSSPSRRKPEAVHRWSPAQSELWLAMAMGDDARVAYNEQVIFDFPADLDAAVLDRAFEMVVNRHPSLRSVVQADEQGMRVKHHIRPEMRIEDLSSVDPTRRQHQAERLASEHIDREFDLKEGPLVRLLVIRLEPGKSWLCLAASHLVCDGWSLDVILQDLSRCYETMRTGCEVNLDVAPTLDEFEKALAGKLEGGDVADAEAYWLEQYKDIPEPTNLPFDFARPAVKTYRGGRQLVSIGAATAEGLRVFARGQGCTLFVASLAAYELLLHKLSGSRDLVIGIPAAGQPHIGLPRLVAHDVNFLPLRERIDPAMRVDALLESVRRNFMNAKASQDFAFGDLLQKIRPQRDPSRMPLITAAFNMDLEMSPVVMEGVRARFRTTPRGFVKYDLFFNLIDLGAGRGMELEVDHNADLMTADTARHWAELYCRLLREMPNEARMPVLELDLGQSDSDARRYLEGDSTVDATSAQTLVSLFESAVDAHGDATALVFKDQTVSYRELDERANQLAHWLRVEGVRPDDAVALLFERSLHMVFAMYGVMKAGGAYLPLDPDNPDARLQEILSTARPRLVLCAHADLPRISPLLPAGIEARAVDALDAGWHSHGTARPEAVAGPQNLAYIIYTSGSTGTPKGVMNEHRGICSRLRWAQRQFQLTTRDVILQKTPYTFDVSVWEFFWPLEVGSRLVIAAPGGHREPKYLRQLIADQGVTVMHFVPSMLSAFLAEPDLDQLTSVRTVICSGEALSANHRDRFFAAFANARLFNLYGPTEAAVDVTWWECHRDDVSTTVPIGFPVANTRLFVLDEAGQPVPRGAHGELYIGGTQVARGYLHNPTLTAERFVTLSLGSSPERAYRTGDLVRERPDGALEFLGRVDSQVKLRGFRIELGEIEAKLMAIDSVHGCAVMVAHHGADDDRLVAFVQPAAGAVISQLKLRRELAAKLPDYMIPQSFTEVKELPLGASGKVDRKALVALLQDSMPASAFVAPQTGTEQRIAAIWSRALNLEQVSAESYFFDIGGHSLMAMSVSREMEAAFGRRFDLREMLMSNLSQLAVLVDAGNSRQLRRSVE